MRWYIEGMMKSSMYDVMKAAMRVLAVDEAHGLPHEDMPFDAFNQWVAALFALKEAVERVERNMIVDDYNPGLLPDEEGYVSPRLVNE